MSILRRTKAYYKQKRGTKPGLGASKGAAGARTGRGNKTRHQYV